MLVHACAYHRLICKACGLVNLVRAKRCKFAQLHCPYCKTLSEVVFMSYGRCSKKLPFFEADPYQRFKTAARAARLRRLVKANILHGHAK